MDGVNEREPMIRIGIRVEGLVQGVGFRPFIYALAARFHLTGYVSNDSRGVSVEVEGERQDVARFLTALEREAPPLALIEQVTSRQLSTLGGTAFVIAPSAAGSQRSTLISPDVATCEDCLHELFDPVDRRFRYPFINCTNCGPRFTIIRDVPYDRAATTMATSSCAAIASASTTTRRTAASTPSRWHVRPAGRGSPSAMPRGIL
jgi:hydrogenase maturation protein HypF